MFERCSADDEIVMDCAVSQVCKSLLVTTSFGSIET